jgi:hypothetical protein
MIELYVDVAYLPCNKIIDMHKNYKNMQNCNEIVELAIEQQCPNQSEQWGVAQ